MDDIYIGFCLGCIGTDRRCVGTDLYGFTNDSLYHFCGLVGWRCIYVEALEGASGVGA